MEGVSTLKTGARDILVVLPTLGDRLEMLERALQSVAIQADSDAVHLVVVTPRDKEQARQRALAFGASLVDDPGAGMSAAINAGLALATSEEYYIWLGDDDAYAPGGLAVLRKLLDQDSGAVVAFGACEYVDDDGQVVWTSRAGALATRILGYGPNLIPHPAALIRLDALREVGGYDETLNLAMDLDVFLKLKGRGRFLSTPAVVSQFGWHDSSLTVQDRDASAREARKVKRRHLPSWLRPLEPLWEFPVQWVSRLVAGTLSRRGVSTSTG